MEAIFQGDTLGFKPSFKLVRAREDLSDLTVEFRVSPTRRMVELHAVYEDESSTT